MLGTGEAIRMAVMNHDIGRIEAAIIRARNDRSSLDDSRRTIRNSLQSLAQIPANTKLSLAETFEAIAHNASVQITRELGLVAIRLVACDGILPSGNAAKADRHLLRIIEHGCPELLEKVIPDKKAQTHEKMAFVKAIHSDACAKLQHLQQPFSSLQDLAGLRQPILKALNHGPLKAYLNGFGYGALLPLVSSLLTLAADVTKSQGGELLRNMQGLLESVDDDFLQIEDIQTFITVDYVIPFIENVKKAALELQASLADKFDCSITIPPSPYELEKKYPLHIEGTHIRVFVPLTNTGPGTAQDVQVSCIADYCNVLSEETRLGDIPQGPFVLTLLFDVTVPTSQVELEVEVRWQIVGDPLPRFNELSVVVEAQRTDLDWDELANRQPYSLEVAYGNDFFGRKDTVRRVLRRLAPGAMQSSYITGQKRVGKSSLARAIESEILSGPKFASYRVIYLECGEFRHASGEETLQDLGNRLEEFLMAHLPRTTDWKAADYSSSLAPVSRLLDQLLQSQPDARFVLIIDEFDEINESLYRYGELANTFFLNLRTLSSKRNIAFVLVGAERMPYVMAAQGEKLNRFEHESLNSFDRDTEWSDYIDLVRLPVQGIVEEHESALFALFRFTNGHPYFTKLLCAATYECAVEAKDAEVSSNEIERAARRVIGTLDINAFAHYWRDGIRGDSEEVEIVSLKRCRLLVAWARTARANNPLTSDAIQANVYSTNLQAFEVLPLLDDFCRRGIFREEDGNYSPTVRLFSDWLVDSGFSRLVADQLGDELADARQIVEDSSYVRSDEIVDVSSKWHLYQGQEVGSELIRSWLSQVESNVEQRLLFKLLKNLRFFGEAEVREKFADAHRWIRNKLPVQVKKSRSQRRKDIIVTFADGSSKSGGYYAAIYANANEIESGNVVHPTEIAKKFEELRQASHVGLVIVDDFIGTGHNLTERLAGMSEVLHQAGIGISIPMSLVALCGTAEGERLIRKHLDGCMPNADLEICEMLDDKHFAFGDTLGFWDTEDEKSMARTLVTDLGTRVNRKSPLGYGGRGLLLTFSRNCPNNSLPILHGSGKASHRWIPLFPRMKS